MIFDYSLRQENTHAPRILNEETIDYISFNKIIKTNRPGYQKGLMSHINTIIDAERDYYCNSFGYRGKKEFKKNQDIVISGCSNTFGMGLQEDHIWGVMLSKELGLDYDNLAIPGLSTDAIINNIFAYIKEYGAPKYIFIVFPHFDRMVLPENPERFIGTYHVNSNNDGFAFSHLDARDFNIPLPSYSKTPHKMIDVIPYEFTFWIAMQSIHKLELFCEYANIKLYYGTWSYENTKTIKHLQNKNSNFFKNFVDLDNNFEWLEFINMSSPDVTDFVKSIVSMNDIDHQEVSIYNNGFSDCHIEHFENNRDCFFYATDKHPVPTKSRHFGLHRHLHFKDAFLKALRVDA
jgi:hypothetical protein